MRRRELGQTGTEINPIGLGGMPLSIQGRPSERQGLRTLMSALEAGIDFIDTADVYCLDDDDIGHNERTIAKAVRQWGGEVLVATKGGMERPGGAWTRNGSPKHLRSACEKSLVALNTDCIDLYQLHAADPKVEFMDSVQTLAQLQSEGKVRYVGLSNVDVAQIRAASELITVTSVQNRCNPYDVRSFDNGVIRYCEQNEITFLAYSPVGGSRNHRRLSKDDDLQAVAQVTGADAYQVALAWLLARSPAMVPIPGASRVSSALSSAGAMDLQLSASDLGRLDRNFFRKK